MFAGILCGLFVVYRFSIRIVISGKTLLFNITHRNHVHLDDTNEVYLDAYLDQNQH